MKKIFNSKVQIIAEIGINHMGNLKLCKKMLIESKKAGADFAKLQIINADESYEKGTESYKLFKKASFNFNQLLKISMFCKSRKIKLFATPGDLHSLKIIKSLNFPLVKISSGLNNNYPLIEEAIKLRKHTIVSTGMLARKEIDSLYNYLKTKTNNFSLLKCTSVYPAKDENLNLSAITIFNKKYKCLIGYSDHTKDDLAVLTAVVNGAKIIEKHFTLNNKLKGYDHKISFEPTEFKNMVDKIRRIEKILGKENYNLSKKEQLNAKKFQRVIFVKKKKFKNETIKPNEVFFMRPKKRKKKFILARDFKKFSRKILKKNIKANSQLTFDCFK